MISEPKPAAEKQPFRSPALVTLAPKRRFKVAPIEEQEEGPLKLNEGSTPLSSGDHPRKLKRFGRVILNRRKATSIPRSVLPYSP
jgi:hypothetical protein